jgi:hypothetical protein
MKIGILGSGDVADHGRRFPEAWPRGHAGHPRRDKAERAGRRSTRELGWAPSRTRRFGEVTVLAVKGTVAQAALEAAGAEAPAGKTVIDAAKPDRGRATRQGVC